MALPASDTFLQTSGGTQALTTYSASWSLVQGTFNVGDNTGYVAGGSGGVTNIARWNADAFNANHRSDVVFSSANISNGIYIGPAVRCQSGAATAYHFDSNGSDNYLVRTVAGSDTILSQPAGSFADGDVCRLKVSGTGATVTLTVEKALAASPTSFSTFATFDDTDAARITTAGYAGVFIYGDTAGGGIVLWSADNTTVSYTIAIGQGTYSHSGQAVGLSYSGAVRTIAVGQGSYTYTGQSVTLFPGRGMVIGRGTYTQTGSDALADLSITLGTGIYQLIGQPVGLSYSGAGPKTMAVGQGAYTTAGQDLSMRRTYAAALAAGSYTLSGKAVQVTYSGAVITGPAAFRLTLNPATGMGL
jgi:hypothetical protein